MSLSQHQIVLRNDPDDDFHGPDLMEFILVYEGDLRSSKGEFQDAIKRSHHVHRIRKAFHRQLADLWATHPTLIAAAPYDGKIMGETFTREDFKFRPMVTKLNGLTCHLNITMMRPGDPINVVGDIDNRLKTLLDSLRMPDGPLELGSGSPEGLIKPDPNNNEKPFYVLVQDDKFISRIAIASEMLLDPSEILKKPNVTPEVAVRLVINVTVKPLVVHQNNLHFA